MSKSPEEILAGWERRGIAVADRLRLLGVPATCRKVERVKEGERVVGLHFEMSSVGEILMAELLAGHLEDVRTAGHLDPRRRQSQKAAEA